MKLERQNLIIKKLDLTNTIPYDLLLLADPSKELVDRYLEKSEVFAAIQADEILGVLALYPLTDDTAEIKNLAVKPECQGQGIGSYLIEEAVRHATIRKLKTVFIGTANSSIRQLSLYQKLGFQVIEVKHDYFIQHYAEPIFENGIQARHMIVLSQDLTHPT
ncbi:MAG: GNAT family N-acetyltransferase [Cyclobacteriaceae bacterium]|nr:GNAT family N-acetyltransferase [Cyclobacteriaceae bacterium]